MQSGFFFFYSLLRRMLKIGSFLIIELNIFTVLLGSSSVKMVSMPTFV